MNVGRLSAKVPCSRGFDDLAPSLSIFTSCVAENSKAIPCFIANAPTWTYSLRNVALVVGETRIPPESWRASDKPPHASKPRPEYRLTKVPTGSHAAKMSILPSADNCKSRHGLQSRQSVRRPKIPADIGSQRMKQPIGFPVRPQRTAARHIADSRYAPRARIRKWHGQESPQGTHTHTVRSQTAPPTSPRGRGPQPLSQAARLTLVELVPAAAGTEGDDVVRDRSNAACQRPEPRMNLTDPNPPCRGKDLGTKPWANQRTGMRGTCEVTPRHTPCPPLLSPRQGPSWRWQAQRMALRRRSRFQLCDHRVRTRRGGLWNHGKGGHGGDWRLLGELGESRVRFGDSKVPRIPGSSANEQLGMMKLIARNCRIHLPAGRGSRFIKVLASDHIVDFLSCLGSSFVRKQRVGILSQIYRRSRNRSFSLSPRPTFSRSLVRRPPCTVKRKSQTQPER